MADTAYWLHVEDLADAYIGPFTTPDFALAHYNWCRDLERDLEAEASAAGLSVEQYTCKHEWNQTAAEADEQGYNGRIYCLKCGVDGDS